jgi:hypothetical protein
MTSWSRACIVRPPGCSAPWWERPDDIPRHVYEWHVHASMDTHTHAWRSSILVMTIWYACILVFMYWFKSDKASNVMWVSIHLECMHKWLLAVWLYEISSKKLLFCLNRTLLFCSHLFSSSLYSALPHMCVCRPSDSWGTTCTNALIVSFINNLEFLSTVIMAHSLLMSCNVTPSLWLSLAWCPHSRWGCHECWGPRCAPFRDPYPYALPHLPSLPIHTQLTLSGVWVPERRCRQADRYAFMGLIYGRNESSYP